LTGDAVRSSLYRPLSLVSRKLWYLSHSMPIAARYPPTGKSVLKFSPRKYVHPGMLAVGIAFGSAGGTTTGGTVTAGVVENVSFSNAECSDAT
jgi:hypothetical protein